MKQNWTFSTQNWTYQVSVYTDYIK